MEQFGNFNRVMEAGTISKNEASLKSQMSKGNTYSKTILLLLLILCFGSCGQKAINIDINGIDLEKTIAKEIDNMLTSFPNSKAIVSYKQVPIQTSEQVFQNLIKENVSKEVILYPNLTYKLNYRSSWTKEKPCEAMAYYALKDGKLVGVGLIFSEKVDLTSVKLPAMGYEAKSTNYFNWMYKAMTIILTILFLPGILRRFVFGNKANPDGSNAGAGPGCGLVVLIVLWIFWFL